MGNLDGLGTAYWDDASTGFYSIGLGYNVKASGNNSISIGQNGLSRGTNTTAIGYGCEASVANSIAISGVGCIAKAQFSVAIGNYASANRHGSVALGRNVNAGYTEPAYGEIIMPLA